MGFEEGFLTDVTKRFKNYKDLGDKTFAQLEEKDFFFLASPQSNSIAVIVQHLSGNMLSRFTNFLTEDGEKAWRNRDAEFETALATKEDVIAAWEDGWACLFDVLASLAPDDLTKIIHIRNEPLPVYDALLRQLAHYPHHVGQILFIGKMVKDEAWQSLSIPKGYSKQANEKMGYKV